MQQLIFYETTKNQKLSKLKQASTLLNQIEDLDQVIGGVITSTSDTSVPGQTTTCTDGAGWKSSITVYKYASWYKSDRCRFLICV